MSRSRRGATGIAGILVIDKPAGMTSHDVVSAIRRSTGEGRVGHAGTLDPAATGVLVVLIGPATRLAPFLSASQKSYEALVAFGVQTDTDDADGAVIRSLPVPGRLRDRHAAASAVRDLVGRHAQLPPAYSAVKRNGVVAHRAARAGEPLALEPRPIEVFEARLEDLEHGTHPVWRLALTVSKGTYIRSIARDLGERSGTVAHLAGLRRTRSGVLGLADAHPLDEVVAAGAELAESFVDPVAALALPVRRVLPGELPRVQAGAPIAPDLQSDGRPGDLVSVADDQRLHAVYRVTEDARALAPVVVLHGGVAR